jgi:hypothetical protein
VDKSQCTLRPKDRLESDGSLPPSLRRQIRNVPNLTDAYLQLAEEKTPPSKRRSRKPKSKPDTPADDKRDPELRTLNEPVTPPNVKEPDPGSDRARDTVESPEDTLDVQAPEPLIEPEEAPKNDSDQGDAAVNTVDPPVQESHTDTTPISMPDSVATEMIKFKVESITDVKTARKAVDRLDKAVAEWELSLSDKQPSEPESPKDSVTPPPVDPQDDPTLEYKAYDKYHAEYLSFLAGGNRLLEVTLPDDCCDFYYYELVEEGKPYREWCIPAEIINRYGTVRRVTANEVG